MLEQVHSRMFMRSMLIQGAWNYERMQNMGFAFCMLPALKAAYPDKQALGRAAARHLELFNTQPFMASLVLGLAVKAEEDIAAAEPAGRPELEARLRAMKNAVASAAAAIGDRVFWGLLRPVSLVVTLVMLGPRMLKYLFTVEQYSAPSSLPWTGTMELLGAVGVGFLFYNVPAVLLRWRGIEHGYACLGSNSCGVDFMDWNRLIKRTRYIGFILSAVLFALFMSFFTRDLLFNGDADYGLHSLVVVGFSVAAAFAVKRFGYTSMRAYMALMALFALFFVIF